MGSIFHGQQVIADGIHGIVSLTYATSGSRLAASGFASTDQYKVAIDQDTGALWVLTNISPITWSSPAPLAVDQTGHQTLRQLIHLAEEGGPFNGFPNCVRDIGPAGNAFPTASVWWVDSTRQQKIVENIVTRNSNQVPVTSVWNVYVSGTTTIAASSTDTITYIGVIETSRTRTTTP